MNEPRPLAHLIDALRCLPGVGPKSAQRMAYHLLQHNKPAAQNLGRALLDAIENLQHCRSCNTYTITELCETCANPKRDRTQLCIVETPADQNVLETTQSYKGLYYVLMGRLSPLEGMGPKQVNFKRLLTRAKDGLVNEVIIATNFTTEGETTAHYVSQMFKAQGLKVSRLARGIPVGSELEYVDSGTIAHALMDRRLE